MHAKLNSLWSYLESDRASQIDPLIRLALLHYQFEAIHPYIDGNGRTGRILNVLFLVHMNFITLPVLYMSNRIIETKSTYYELLLDITRNSNWEAWILYIIDIVETTARSSRELVSAIRLLRSESVSQIKLALPKLKSIYDLTELLFYQPYSRIESYVNAGLGTRKTVTSYLNALESLGIVQRHKSGTSTIFLNVPLYELLLEKTT